MGVLTPSVMLYTGLCRETGSFCGDFFAVCAKKKQKLLRNVINK